MDADDPDGDPGSAAEADGGVRAASEDAVADRVGPDAVAGTVTVAGKDFPVALDDRIVEAAQDADDVDLDRIRDAAVPDDAIAGDVPDGFDYDLTPRSGRVHAQDDSATIPVQDRRDALLATTHDVSDFDFIQDPQIRKLQQNSVDYTHRVGRYLLAKDDLIPGVKERIKALIVGSEGMAVEPSDPERDADQRLADHLRELYDGDVRPTDVIDVILRENLTHARTVLRATDLEELDLRTLDYLKDGISGEEIYMQDPTTVYEFDVDEGTRDDPGDINIERRQVDSQPLVIGEQVFDISLYDTPPLKAVVDTTINKMVMQRLKARKAELTSFGAVYATVEPPSYLPENQYFDRVQDDDYDTGGTPPTKLERALRENMESAFDHLKDWQSGTTAAIPDYWSFEQIEIPENNEPLDKQIRGYNRSIARRMLVPLDLIELRDGAELSRETLFRTLMTTIAGWRQEIIRVFDQFARVQTDIHGLDGSVEHTFPPIQDQDEELVVQALQYAGIAGLTEKEVRQMLNNIEGIDLNVTDDTAPQPPSGGPDDAGDRSQRMQDFLNEQNNRGRQPPDQGDQGDGGAVDQPGQDWGDGSRPPATAQSDGAAGDFPATCRSCGDRQRIAGRFKCPACADDVDADSFDGDLADAPGQAADVDLSIPDAVQNAAQMALDARNDPDVTVNGMTDRGWSRADTLAAGGNLSPSDVVGSSDAMANWWSRHFDNIIDTSGDRTTLQHASADAPWRENSYTAGMGWGGVAGARYAFRKAAELTDGDASDGWRDWVDRVQAQAGGSGNLPPLPATAASAADSRLAEPLAGVPVIPDGQERLSKDTLIYWHKWVTSGRPMTDVDARRFNPELHPRGPDGKFVERPWDVPDSILDNIDDLRTTPTADILQELDAAGEPISDVLQDDSISIDGIPDDVNSVGEAKQRLGGDGLAFQDLEEGDVVKVVDDDTGALAEGNIEKTEQVDGGPNRVHLSTKTGVRVADVPNDGSATIKRFQGPAKPPLGIDSRDAITPDEIQTDRKVSVVTGFNQGDPTHVVTGDVSGTGELNSLDSITVAGNEYAPAHKNVQVYDAEPEPLDPSTITEGDQVKAFEGPSQYSGEVVGKQDIGGVTVLDVDTGDGVMPMGDDTTEFYPQDDVVDTDGDVTGQTQDIVDELPDLDDADAGDITPGDLPPGAIDDVLPSEVGPGDWILNQNQDQVGQIIDEEDSTITVNYGGQKEQINLFSVTDVPKVQDGDLDMDDDGPDVSDIDPSTVSATAINDDQLSGELSASDFQNLNEGDWVALDTGDGTHAGKVTEGPPNLSVETGHHTDPQQPGAVDNIESIQQIDPDAVDDVGDVAGTQTPTTSTPDAPDSDLDVSDITDNPATPDDIDDADLYHPATPGGRSDVGLVDEAQIKAFHELLEDPDQGGVNLFDPSNSKTTSHKHMDYPQSNPYKLRDHIAHFANEALDADNGNEAAERLLSQAGSWKGSSYTDVGQGLEKRFHAGLDLPGDFRDDGLDGDEPSDDDAVTAALMTAATQEFIRRNFDDIDQQDFWGEASDDGEIPLYRGVGKNAVAALARDWADNPEADELTVNESKMTNWSTDAGLADNWGERGHVLKKNATPDDIVYSPDLMTGPETGIDSEGEIWTPGGVDAGDPRNIQVEPGSDEATMDMADMMEPPEDMDSDQLRIVGRWAEAMEKRSYTLDTQSQIDTFQRAADQIKQDPGTSDTPATRIETIVSNSQQELADQGSQTAPADD